MGGRRPVAFFQMSVRTNVSFEELYRIAQEIERKYGADRGYVGYIPPSGDGLYFLVCYTDDCADLLQRKLQSAGIAARRLRKLPPLEVSATLIITRVADAYEARRRKAGLN